MLRRLLVGVMTVLLVVQGFVPIAVAADDKDPAAGRPARVAADKLNLRGGPGSTFSVVRSLVRGTAVTVLEEQGDWSRVRLDDGVEGWVASKYLDITPATAAPGERTREGRPGGEQSPPGAAPSSSSGQPGGGGSALRPILKWGCLAGAVVAGGLWYGEHSSGNDAYDEYKSLYEKGEYTSAETKYQEATDHDDKAQVYAIAGGVLAGLFVLQQFVLGGGHHSEQAGIEILPPPAPLTAGAHGIGPRGGELRAEVVRVRF